MIIINAHTGISYRALPRSHSLRHTIRGGYSTEMDDVTATAYFCFAHVASRCRRLQSTLTRRRWRCKSGRGPATPRGDDVHTRNTKNQPPPPCPLFRHGIIVDWYVGHVHFERAAVTVATTKFRLFPRDPVTRRRLITERRDGEPAKTTTMTTLDEGNE